MINRRDWRGALTTTFVFLLTGCWPFQANEAPSVAPVTVAVQPFNAPNAPCTDTFAVHQLDHITAIEGEVVRMFESNGAGLAINDLDNDGDLDLVLGNLAGPNSLYWNEGNLTFRKQTLPHGDTRGVATVDVDGDGWLDLIFTRRLTAPTHWHNRLANVDESTAATDELGFVETFLPGLAKQAYAMAWGDIDKDGDVDLVTGSYDLALEMALGDKFRNGPGAGIYYYANEGEQFTVNFLTRHAQTLALLLLDVDGDGWQDIVAGNDFDQPDLIWRYDPSGWQATTPFTQTTQNTMSFDTGDINNDGSLELFAADMMPYAHDAATMAAWQPVMDRMPHVMQAGDPQIMANVLQMRQTDGRFANLSPENGVAATGWSWSAKFGDLDNDGFLDLYVVNGMAALDLFDHLPNNELVEENQVFQNQAGQGFSPAPAWGLNATEGGRGMSMGDLDNDGDLDIVVNNLLRPAKLFENQLCGGASLQVDLAWPESKNSHALGAQLILHTDKGNLTRDVRAVSGYLSGDPTRVHFGFPADAVLTSLDIHWPDGATSTIDAPATGILQITRQ